LPTRDALLLKPSLPRSFFSAFFKNATDNLLLVLLLLSSILPPVLLGLRDGLFDAMLAPPTMATSKKQEPCL
jgi:hypothetical protein